MPAARTFVLWSCLLLAGCGLKVPQTGTGGKEAPPPPDAATTLETAPATATPSETASSSAEPAALQTVEYEGLTLQMPGDWKVLTTTPALGISTPNDFQNGIPGIPVSVSIVPTQAPLTATQLYDALVEGERSVGGEVSEQPVSAGGGLSGTRVEAKTTSRQDETSDAVNVTRSVKVYIPLDNGVLAVQMLGPDEYVAPLLAKFDALVATIARK